MDQDKFAGQGGSYTRDPVTGARTLIERTNYVPPEAAPAPTATPAAPAASAAPAATTPAATQPQATA